MRRRVDRQYLTDRLSHLHSLSDYRLHRFLRSIHIVIDFRVSRQKWKYERLCVTMSYMYREKTNKESVLFVAGIA